MTSFFLFGYGMAVNKKTGHSDIVIKNKDEAKDIS